MTENPWTIKQLEQKFGLAQLISYKENEKPSYLIFGSFKNGNIYKFFPKTSKIILYDKYPNKFEPAGHTAIFYKNHESNSNNVLSFGGPSNEYEHFLLYNINTKQWKNIKYNKNKYYINYGSKACITNDKKYIIITCLNKNYKNSIYILFHFLQ